MSSVLFKKIDLFPKEVWEKGIVGDLLHWSLAIGRYIVIFTELVVISAFLYRFGLDRKLMDLQRQMKQKQIIVDSFENTELKFRDIQQKLETITTIDKSNALSADKMLKLISKITPLDTVYNSIRIDEKAINLKGETLSKIGLATLLTKAQEQKEFKDVVLDSVSSATEKTQAINFIMVLSLREL